MAIIFKRRASKHAARTERVRGSVVQDSVDQRLRQLLQQRVQQHLQQPTQQLLPQLVYITFTTKNAECP